jgi:hypothetical protein
MIKWNNKDSVLNISSSKIITGCFFQERYPETSAHIIHEVEKMLKCGSPEGGFATYLCPECHHEIRIPFSCKSKLCSRCGKKHTDLWSQSVAQYLLNTDHRHIVLTVPEMLWEIFINNEPLQKDLLNTAAKVIKKVFSQKGPLTIGLILVLHPFGDDLKSNFHVHAVVTAGGLSENNEWVKVDYIDYGFIRRTWQYEILTTLRKHQVVKDSIIDRCFNDYPNGFVIFADRIIKGSKRGTLSYVARYTKHPPISQRRILAYDGEMVTFSYESNGQALTKQMPKLAFIKAVLQHTSGRQFKMVRRFGLYARRAGAKYQQAVSLLPTAEEAMVGKFSWRKNLITFRGKDPLRCSVCGREMQLYQITYVNKWGFLESIKVNEGLEERILKKFFEEETQDERERYRERYQVYLSEMSG